MGIYNGTSVDVEATRQATETGTTIFSQEELESTQ